MPSKLEDALKVKGTRIYHHKGYYTLVIVDYFEDSDKNPWVCYFNADNAGTKYQEYDGAFMAQFNGKPCPPEHVTFEKFYNENMLRVASLDRLMEKTADGKPKLQLTKPTKTVEFKPINIRL